MRRFFATLVMALTACGTQVAADEPLVPAPVAADFFLGDWEVDVPALESVESFRALSPEAQASARALLAGLRWRLAFDSRRVHLPDGRVLPFTVESADERSARLILSEGEPLQVERRVGGLRLVSHDLPLRRAE